MTQPAAINFGTCWGTPGGQDLAMPSYMATGFRVVGEAIARRWTTTQGQLIDDPNYGTNINDSIGDDLSDTDIQELQAALSNEAQKDARVLNCKVTLTLGTDGTLTVTGQVTTADGPFQLVLSVGSVTPAILLVEP